MTNILHTAKTGMSIGGLFAMIYVMVNYKPGEYVRKKDLKHVSQVKTS